MILGLGTDLCENTRIGHLYQKFGHKFLERIFSKEEIEYCCSKRDPIPHLTAPICSKRSFYKST